MHALLRFDSTSRIISKDRVRDASMRRLYGVRGRKSLAWRKHGVLLCVSRENLIGRRQLDLAVLVTTVSHLQMSPTSCLHRHDLRLLHGLKI